jgi:hypothetical protein
MKTAVEWLQSQIVFESVDKELLARWDEDSDLSEYFEQAKEMEKEQIIEAFAKGSDEESDYHGFQFITEDKAIEYYNETFKQQE